MESEIKSLALGTSKLRMVVSSRNLQGTTAKHI